MGRNRNPDVRKIVINGEEYTVICSPDISEAQAQKWAAKMAAVYEQRKVVEAAAGL